MTFKSINPYSGKEIAGYEEHSDNEIAAILDNADQAGKSWRGVSVDKRCDLLLNAADLLRNKSDEYAKTVTSEMGKPVSESRAEIEKCAWACEFYAENAGDFLADELIETDASESFISYDPLGCVLAIMPWNFPLWQVFRFAVPTLAAGNTAILKHASNVLGTAIQIQDLFLEAGFPKGVFQNLIIDHDKTEKVISHETVRAVTLTGSERAGRSVAALAGKHLKKSLLELGGSNAFIVLEDADIEQAVQTGFSARMMNCGQSCIAAKRFILVGNTYDRFLPLFLEKVKSLSPGDPMDESTQIGPLARKDLADNLQKQLKKSVEMGAELQTGGGQNGAFHDPSVLTNVRPGMPAFDEETFGPLAAFTRAVNDEEAFSLASDTRYGLGLTVCTSDIRKALHYTDNVHDGAYFINELVKSDPRLPFGGTRNSGYGRELSREGILEFVNKKTVYVNS